MHSTLTSLKVYNSSEKIVFCPSIVIVGVCLERLVWAITLSVGVASIAFVCML